jgi:hypothetical protein
MSFKDILSANQHVLLLRYYCRLSADYLWLFVWLSTVFPSDTENLSCGEARLNIDDLRHNQPTHTEHL